jgi:hypothetical protein
MWPMRVDTGEMPKSDLPKQIKYTDLSRSCPIH